MKNMDRIYHVAENDAFLDAILPCDFTRTDAIFNDIVKQGFYDDKSRRWKNFPQEMPGSILLEKEFHSPFVQVAEAISRSVFQSRHPGSNPARRWIDLQSKTPKSADSLEAGIQPGVIFGVNAEWVRKLEEEIGTLKLEYEVLADGAGTGTKPSPAEKRLLLGLNVWWRSIYSPTAIKSDPNEEQIAFEQVWGYLRLCLQNQLDRRFIIGLTFCYDKLNVWLCDRSGVVGMAESVNIHEDPHCFIRIISSLSTLDPEKLGWDTTMKLYTPNSPEHRYSYNVENVEADFGLGQYGTRWVIDVISEDGIRHESFVTITPLSITQAEMMRGRATLVWEVIKLSELHCPKEIYVLKRYWRPYTKPSSTGPAQVYRKSEGQMYELFNSKAERIYSHGDICIAGAVDSTIEGIRSNLEVQVRSTTTTQRKQGTHQDYDAFEPRLNHKNVHDLNQQNPLKIHAIESRAHTEVVMRKTGWPIRNFASLVELCGVLLQSIKDSKELFENGALHRDISSGNIIITALDNDGKTFEGRLIDLDHAKWSPYKARVKKVTITDEDAKDFQATMWKHYQLRVDEKVAMQALQGVGNEFEYAMLYLKVLRTRLDKKLDESPYSCQDLQWIHENTKRPTYRLHQPSQVERTGTVPYMSAEVLAGDFSDVYYNHRIRPKSQRFCWENPDDLDECHKNHPKLPDGSSDFFHDAIHDMESVLWVLIEICLTRRGPGNNMHRDELNPDHENHSAELERVVKSLFDSPDERELMGVKSEMLRTDSLDDIIPHFHPYFKPLVQMIKTLWAILVTGYQFRAFEYHHIHQYFITIFASKTQELEAMSFDKDLEEKEYARRRDYLASLVNTFATLTISAPLPARETAAQDAPPVASSSGSRTLRDPPITPTAARRHQVVEDSDSERPKKKRRR